MREKIVLIGGGGHCKVVIDAILAGGEYDIAGIIDRKLEAGTKVLGVSVLGDDALLKEAFEKGIKNAFVAVGSVGDCTARKAIYENIKKMGFNIPHIIHPKAVIACDVEFGEGAFVAASATINPGTKIGKMAIINTSSSVDHDCRIGDFVHIAPGVTLSGGVNVGDGTHIGTGASVVQCVSIGKGCMVKAGVRVSQDMGDVEE